MIPHDILTLYSAKMLEYLLAVLFLVAFIPFWRYVQGSVPAAAWATVKVRRPVPMLADWFTMPANGLFHRGHTWAKLDADGLVTVGLDDFAAKLVGRLSRVSLPGVGTTVGQGEKAWRLVADDGRAVEMLSPVDGTVADVNAALETTPDTVEQDPYQRGWLLRVRPSRWRANHLSLLSGAAARQWMEEVLAGLRAQYAPGLGVLVQDGGAPMHGMARAIDPDHWDTLAATFFLTSEEDTHG